MDWMIAAAAVIAGWTMLSVLTGERAAQQNRIIESINARAAAEKAAAAKG